MRGDLEHRSGMSENNEGFMPVPFTVLCRVWRPACKAITLTPQMANITGALSGPMQYFSFRHQFW